MFLIFKNANLKALTSSINQLPPEWRPSNTKGNRLQTGRNKPGSIWAVTSATKFRQQRQKSWAKLKEKGPQSTALVAEESGLTILITEVIFNKERSRKNALRRFVNTKNVSER